MFLNFIIDLKTNPFNELSTSIKFENITDGRQGAVLVDCKRDLIPLVRTTTIYNNPPNILLPIHHEIIENIKKASKISELEFNNALIEIYDSNYCKMGFHTDQSLDLVSESYICVFSCYEDPKTTDIRKLQIKNKITGKIFEISLKHNSIVLFSVLTNCEHLHKIISEKTVGRWLGITFRLSKTFIKFKNNKQNFPLPYFINDRILRIASEEEKREFMKHKSLENKNINYDYPTIDYTISPSDTKIPI